MTREKHVQMYTDGATSKTGKTTEAIPHRRATMQLNTAAATESGTELSAPLEQLSMLSEFGYMKILFKELLKYAAF